MNMQQTPEEKQLIHRTRYLSRYINSAVAFALRGPVWLPMKVRKIPLTVLLKIYALHTIGL